MFKNLSNSKRMRSIDYSQLWVDTVNKCKQQLSDTVTEDYFISFAALHEILNMDYSIEDIDNYELESIMEVHKEIDNMYKDNGLTLAFLKEQYSNLRYRETKFSFNEDEVTNEINPQIIENQSLNKKYANLILRNIEALKGNEDLMCCVLDSYLYNNMNNDKR